MLKLRFVHLDPKDTNRLHHQKQIRAHPQTLGNAEGKSNQK